MLTAKPIEKVIVGDRIPSLTQWDAKPLKVTAVSKDATSATIKFGGATRRLPLGTLVVVVI